MTASAGSVTQVSRLLAMVPWLVQRPGVTVAEAAREFGVTEKQLQKDLTLASLCGTPGYYPDDLIEVDVHGGRVWVSNAQRIARPRRLRPDEATALLVALRLLAAVPGASGSDALERVTAKLQTAAGDAAGLESRIAVTVETDPELVARLTAAAADGCRLRMRYYVPARDEVTERDVDPIRLPVLDGRTYLEGWCHLADDIRLFRLDRVESVEVLDVATDVPSHARTRDLADAVFLPADQDPRVVLDLAPEARWVVDTFPYEAADEQADGTLRVTLRVGDPRWVVRLLLRLGGCATVVSPAGLRDQLAAAAGAARGAYDVGA